jgi:hypothetical protein
MKSEWKVERNYIDRKALKLKDPDEILAAAKDAEARNCEQWVIRKLYAMYYAAAGDKSRKRS